MKPVVRVEPYLHSLNLFVFLLHCNYKLQCSLTLGVTIDQQKNCEVEKKDTALAIVLDLCSLRSSAASSRFLEVWPWI